MLVDVDGEGGGEVNSSLVSAVTLEWSIDVWIGARLRWCDFLRFRGSGLPEWQG